MAKAPREASLTPTDEANMMAAIGESSDTGVVEQDEGPSYKIVGTDSKIPVSKVRGKLVCSWRDAALKDGKETFEAWDEAENYYHATQDAHRDTNKTPDISGNAAVRLRKNRITSEQENIVFANTAALVPSLYAKSPEITITGNNDELKELYDTVKEVGISIITRKTYPGVNLKPKVRKAIVAASLMNEGWIEIGWTKKADSSEQALQDLKKLSDEFASTKDLKRLKEIIAEIQALETRVEVLTPSGPWAKYRHPKQVLVDPTANEDDGMDANWMMVWDMIPTNTLNAIYGEKDSKGEWKSIYKPTHKLAVVSGSNSNVDEQVKNFKLFTTDDANDQKRNTNLDMTKCWWVFDKTTRRIELYPDNNWSWPIWVWDDQLHLDRFYPLYKVSFHTSPTFTRTKGEVSYYLDQQDAINEINDTEARAREMVRGNGFFDSNLGLDEKTVMEVLRGSDGTMRGVKIPEGKKIDEMFVMPTPEMLKYPALFDDAAKQRKFQAIDRISSVNDVRRGGQFKTNTTNKAIDTYNSIDNTRLDDRIDAIEDFIGDITWGLMQICLQFMEQTLVAVLVGKQRAQVWKPMSPEEIFTSFASCRVDGGSTSKPTSKAKKEEAIKLGQVLGQFAQLAPGPVLKVLFTVMERAFDEFIMTDQDWAQLDQAIFGGQSATGPGTEVPPELQQILDQLPPEAQTAIQELINRGAPIDQVMQAAQKIMAQVSPPQGEA